MSIHKIHRKRVFCALFLFSLSSCGTSCNLWQDECTIGSRSDFNSARMYLSPPNETSGLELEFVRMATELRLYLNVFGLEIPPDPCDPSTSQVYVSFKDRSYCFAAPRFLGGQRLLIPEQVELEIVRYLEDDQPVFIRVGRYQADIYPDKFLEVYNRMITVPM